MLPAVRKSLSEMPERFYLQSQEPLSVIACDAPFPNQAIKLTNIALERVRVAVRACPERMARHLIIELKGKGAGYYVSDTDTMSHEMVSNICRDMLNKIRHAI